MSNRAGPVFGATEDLLMGIFKRYFKDHPEITILPEYHEGMTVPAIMARADRRSGVAAFHESNDDRFMKPVVISVSTFATGKNADRDAHDLNEAARIALRTAQMEQWVVPGAGHIAVIDNSTPATHVADWATPTTAVQYASLPADVVRYEAIYRLMIRPPVGGSGNPYLA